MSETSSIKRPKAEKIMCNKCDISFSKKASLYCHQRRYHPDEVVSGSGTIICGICNEKFFVIMKLHEHLTAKHNVNLHFEKKTFYCDEEFQEWKNTIEKETLTSFRVKNCRYNKNTGIKHSYYICHRSGAARLKDDRKRRLKSTGSVKVGCTCPAIIHCSTQVIDEACEMQVLYQSVHIGHEIEVRKLPLPKEDRAKLALSLRVGVPLDKILDQTRQTASSARLSCITRKDLHNICRDMGIPYVYTNVQRSSDGVTEVPCNESNLVIEEPEGNIHSGIGAVVSVSHNSSNVQNTKTRILKTITQVRRKLKKVNSPEVLDYVEDQLNALNAFLDQFKRP